MRTLWRGIVSTIFWSYERGSWPYDLAVILIVIFVLITPTRWFHDQPQTTAQFASKVQLQSEDAASNTHTYRLDATALPVEKRAARATPELERETHDILARTVDDLKDQTFQVVHIEPVPAQDGSILYYDVTVHPSPLM
ncbi:MAG TPA: hypothetical protein VK703_11580 [Candidatus Acidoferrales bacterium]|jgi:hypothetical protein|nr:hypothetical protein [Candidatus Acidoferrales bacterium]